MSSILLSNPFVTQAPPPGVAAETTSVPVIAPTIAASQGRAAGNSTGFSGSGNSGTSDQGANVALFRKMTNGAFPRPADATRSSVVAAQTQTEQPAPLPGAGLPEVSMPDPLPTSPFLKRG